MPDRPFMEITSAEVWAQVRKNSDDLLKLRGEFDDDRKDGYDREARIRKLELRYYAILAGIVTGFIGYALTLAKGVLVR